jgi:hypothetical protein
MILKNALMLHNEDEVTVKKTKQVLQVITTKLEKYNNGKKILRVYCTDGNWYDHTELS